MKKKLIIALPLLLIVGFLGYKMFGPKPPEPKMKVEGVLAKMDPEFMINLSDGRFAKMTVALQLDEKDPLAEEILAGRIKDGDTVKVDVKGGLLTFNGVPVGGKTVVDPKVVKLH